MQSIKKNAVCAAYAPTWSFVISPVSSMMSSYNSFIFLAISCSSFISRTNLAFTCSSVGIALITFCISTVTSPSLVKQSGCFFNLFVYLICETSSFKDSFINKNISLSSSFFFFRASFSSLLDKSKSFDAMLTNFLSSYLSSILSTNSST